MWPLKVFTEGFLWNLLSFEIFLSYILCLLNFSPPMKSFNYWWSLISPSFFNYIIIIIIIIIIAINIIAISYYYSLFSGCFVMICFTSSVTINILYALKSANIMILIIFYRCFIKSVAISGCRKVINLSSENNLQHITISITITFIIIISIIIIVKDSWQIKLYIFY